MTESGGNWVFKKSRQHCGVLLRLDLKRGALPGFGLNVELPNAYSAGNNIIKLNGDYRRYVIVWVRIIGIR